MIDRLIDTIFTTYATHACLTHNAGFVATHGAKLRAIVQDIANDDDANPAFPLGMYMPACTCRCTPGEGCSDWDGGRSRARFSLRSLSERQTNRPQPNRTNLIQYNEINSHPTGPTQPNSTQPNPTHKSAAQGLFRRALVGLGPLLPEQRQEPGVLLRGACVRDGFLSLVAMSVHAYICVYAPCACAAGRVGLS